LERRTHLAKNNEYLHKQVNDKAFSHQTERQRVIEDERENHQRLQSQIAEEKHYNRMQKAQAAHATSEHLNSLDRQKKEEFERKKNDITNKI